MTEDTYSAVHYVAVYCTSVDKVEMFAVKMHCESQSGFMAINGIWFFIMDERPNNALSPSEGEKGCFEECTVSFHHDVRFGFWVLCQVLWTKKNRYETFASMVHFVLHLVSKLPESTAFD